jgi:hypothetical protein
VPGRYVSSPSARRWLIATGLLLLVAGLYVLSGPGRIDSIDGQIRFDVALSLSSLGRPILRDPAVLKFGVPGLGDHLYPGYGAGASIAGLPLVWLGSFADDPFGETRRFLFALATPLMGALIAPLLFWFYLVLGVAPRQAAKWVLVSSLASLVWPASTTVLDQMQHAVLVFLALLLGFLASRRDSPLLAAAGGGAAGLLITYQEPYVLLIPLLALSTLGGSSERSRKVARLVIFVAAAGVGLALWMNYNLARFGNPFDSGKIVLDSGHPALLGNPLMGLTGLLASPGKSIFLYSPTILLGLLGWSSLRRREPWLGITILAVSGVHLLFISSLSFFHGDWCWGPRYLVILLPLWALAFPFAVTSGGRRWWVVALVTAGVVVQLLGLSIVHERFFFERGLPTFFWAGNPGFYFRHSALAARPLELWSSLTVDVPPPAKYFSPTPYPRLVTYFIAGFPPDRAPAQMRQFRVFYVPRPWPLWMPRLDREQHDPPVNAPLWSGALVGVALLGWGLIALGTRGRETGGPPEVPPQ